MTYFCATTVLSLLPNLLITRSLIYSHSKILLKWVCRRTSFPSSDGRAGTSMFFCMLSIVRFLTLSRCTILVRAVALMYSGNPDLLKTSSPYTRYIGLVLPSIADSIPYEHISAIEKLRNYLFPTPVHRSPSFYSSSIIHVYTIDFCRVNVNFIPIHSPMYLQELNPFMGPAAESSSSLSRPWSLNLSRSCREVADFGTLLYRSAIL